MANSISRRMFAALKGHFSVTASTAYVRLHD
jgi:hypothetical protein